MLLRIQVMQKTKFFHEIKVSNYFSFPFPGAENASAANVENENPVDDQIILEPIHLAGTSRDGKWKCPYCPYVTKYNCSIVRKHIQHKHFGNNFILLLRLFVFYFIAKCKQIVLV